MKIYCTGCQKDVQARLTDGKEIYGHRPDLHDLPFWKCDTCKNFVGCHHKSTERTKPLGCIPTKEIKKARQEIHKILDPLWKKKLIKRGKLYRKIGVALGIQDYHTAEIRSVEEARQVYRVILDIRKELSCQKS